MNTNNALEFLGQAAELLDFPTSAENTHQLAPMLNRLQREFGRDNWSFFDPQNPSQERCWPVHLDSAIIIEDLSERRRLRNTLTALMAATKRAGVPLPSFENQTLAHQFAEADLGAVSMPQAILQATQACQAAGVFEVRFDPHSGLPETTDAVENPEMSMRFWVTDALRVVSAMRERVPFACQRAVLTLARAYSTPAEQQALRHPEHYVSGGRDVGPAHVFLVTPQGELTRDPEWNNNKRLESHGLALRVFCESIIAGAQGVAWGVYPNEVSDEFLHAIAGLSGFLSAINYPTAPSAGCWEEIAINGGLTWDTEAIRSGLEMLYALVFSSKIGAYPGIAGLRERLRRIRPDLEVLGNQSFLENQIAIGLQRVLSTYLAESPGRREADASLSFLAASETALFDPTKQESIGDSAVRRAEILRFLERQLVRERGIIRYSPFRAFSNNENELLPDAYLGLNYWLSLDESGRINPVRGKIAAAFGSKDASDPSVFRARVRLTSTDHEAQWFMVSEMALGWCRVAQDAKSAIDATNIGNGSHGNYGHLVRESLEMAEQYLRRAFARVTESGTKSNGCNCPGWRVPEAYEWVSALPNAQGKSRSTLLPGAHVPLSWAAVSLETASRVYANLAIGLAK